LRLNQVKKSGKKKVSSWQFGIVNNLNKTTVSLCDLRTAGSPLRNFAKIIVNFAVKPSKKKAVKRK
jgi:hypothetical protein